MRLLSAFHPSICLPLLSNRQSPFRFPAFCKTLATDNVGEGYREFPSLAQQLFEVAFFSPVSP